MKSSSLIFSALILSLFLAIPTPVSALTNVRLPLGKQLLHLSSSPTLVPTVTSTPTSALVKSPLPLKKELQLQKRNFLTEAKKTLLGKIYQNAKDRLTNRAKRLQTLKTQLAARIDSKTQEGKDASSAKTKLNQIAQFETAYTADLAALDAKYQEVLQSSKPLQSLPALRQAAKKVNDDLKEIRQLEIQIAKILINL